MNLVELLKDLDSRRVVLAFAFFVGLLAPGFLTVFVLDQKIFLEIDFLKLIVLSAAITSPSFLLLFITTLIGDQIAVSMRLLPKGRLGGFSDWFITHGISNGTIFYTALLVRYALDFTVRGFIWTLAFLLGLYVVLEIVRIFKLGASENFDPIVKDPKGPPQA